MKITFAKNSTKVLVHRGYITNWGEPEPHSWCQCWSQATGGKGGCRAWWEVHHHLLRPRFQQSRYDTVSPLATLTESSVLVTTLLPLSFLPISTPLWDAGNDMFPLSAGSGWESAERKLEGDRKAGSGECGSAVGPQLWLVLALPESVCACTPPPRDNSTRQGVPLLRSLSPSSMERLLVFLGSDNPVTSLCFLTLEMMGSFWS